MKKLLLLVVIISISKASIAGAFYTNVVVIGASFENVMNYMKTNNYEAILLKINNFETVIYEKKMDTQYDCSAFCEEISKELNCIIIYSLVHDSDILLMTAYKNGNSIFAYDSWPGYFQGLAPKPKIENLKAFLLCINKSDKYAAINKIMSDTPDKYIFAEDLHQEIVQNLKLPKEIVRTGFRYLYGSDKIKFDKRFKTINLN